MKGVLARLVPNRQFRSGFMNSRTIKAVAVFAAVVCVAFATARTEPNSFLNKPAATHEQLMKQIQNDDQVMNRYMRHFGMTRPQVIEYFKGLKLDTLTADGVYLVYNVPESEELRAKAIFYKAGTKVWVDGEGTIVLKASCGNPMKRGTDETSIEVEQPVTADLIRPEPTVVAPQGTPAELVVSTMPSTIESSALPFPAAAPADITEIIRSGGASFNPGFLAPLAIVPFIIKDNPKEPVPEPATFAALAAGAAIVARKRKSAKK